ncbi:hypothetical protein FISHEDRAFT_61752 [Fistulina hepatica ATCC 64428]|uniref:Uncharacterized protein n=1 Tax=Fistulina hepatica ATCC 64428 TaxID=1128425 RepID=A0A0D7A2W8_9AGAR|nr:hypothetical protein FISHEDRAFT_61752 [Fistulina hepatica ATCC 64428]
MKFATVLVAAFAMLSCVFAASIYTRETDSFRTRSNSPRSVQRLAARASKGLICTGQQVVPGQPLPANWNVIKEQCPWLYHCVPSTANPNKWTIAATPKTADTVAHGYSLPTAPLPTASDCALHCHCD